MYNAPNSTARTEVRRPERAGVKNAAVRRMLGGASLLLLSTCLGRVGGGRFFTPQMWADACQAGTLVFVLMFGESGRTAPTSTEVMLSTFLGASIGALGAYLQSRVAILVVLVIAIILIHHPPPKKARTQPTAGASTSGYATPSFGFWQLLLASYWFVARSATGHGLVPCISTAACHAALLLAAAELLEALSPPPAGTTATANPPATAICDLCRGNVRNSAAAMHGRFSDDVATGSGRWSPRASLVDVPPSPRMPTGGRLGLSRSMGFGARAAGHGVRRRRNSLSTALQGPECGADLPPLPPGAFPLPRHSPSSSRLPRSASVAVTAARAMVAEAPCAPGSPTPPPSVTTPTADSLEATGSSRDAPAMASAPLPGGPSRRRPWPRKGETSRSAVSRPCASASAWGDVDAGAAAGPCVGQLVAGRPEGGGEAVSPSGGSSSGPPAAGVTMPASRSVSSQRTQVGSHGEGQRPEKDVAVGMEEGSLQGRSTDAAASGPRGTGVAGSVASQPGKEKRSFCGAPQALQPAGSVAGSGSAHGGFTLISNPPGSEEAAPAAATPARYADGYGEEDEKGDEEDRAVEVNRVQALAEDDDDEEEYDSEAYRHTYDSEDCFSLHGAVDGNGATAEGNPYDQRIVGVPYGGGVEEGGVWRKPAAAAGDSTAGVCTNDAVGVRGVRLDAAAARAHHACGPRHHFPHEYIVLPPPDQYECDISDVADLEDLMSLEEVERAAAAAGEEVAAGGEEPMAPLSGTGDVAHGVTWVLADGPQMLAGAAGSGAIVLDLRAAANELSRRRLETAAPTGQGEMYGSGRRSEEDDVRASGRPTPNLSPQHLAAAEISQPPPATPVTALPLMDTFLRDAALLADINSNQHGHGMYELEGCCTPVHGHAADALPVSAALEGVEQRVVVESIPAPGTWRASSAAARASAKASIGASGRAQERRSRDMVRHLQPPQQHQLLSSYGWRGTVSRKSHVRKLSAGQLLARQMYGIVDRCPGETSYGANTVDERCAGSGDLPVAGQPSVRGAKRGPYLHQYHSFSIAVHQQQQQLQSLPAPQPSPSQLHASSELLAVRQQLQDLQECAASNLGSHYHVVDGQHPSPSIRTPHTPGTKRSEDRDALASTRRSMDAAIEATLAHHHSRSPLSSAAAADNVTTCGRAVGSGGVVESIRMASAGAAAAAGWQLGQRHHSLRMSSGDRRHRDLVAGTNEHGLRAGDVDAVATIVEHSGGAGTAWGVSGGGATTMEPSGVGMNWSPAAVIGIGGTVTCMATDSDAPPPGEDEMFGLGEDSEDTISPTAASADAEEALRLQHQLLLQKEVLQHQQLMLQQELLQQQQQWLLQQPWVAMPEAGHQQGVPMHRTSGSPVVVLQPSSAKAAVVTCEVAAGCDGAARVMHRQQQQHHPGTGAPSTAATTTTLIEPFSAVGRPPYRSLSQSLNQSSYDSQRRMSDVSTTRPYNSAKYSVPAAANTTSATIPVPTAASASAAAAGPVSVTNSIATVPSTLPIASTVPSSTLPDSSIARADMERYPSGTDTVVVSPPAAEELQDIAPTPFLGDQGFRAAVAAAVAADPATEGDVLPPTFSILTSLVTRVTLPSDGGAAVGGGGGGFGGTTSPLPQESWGGSATWGGDSELSGPVGTSVEVVREVREAENVGVLGAVAQAVSVGEMETVEKGRTVGPVEVSVSDGGRGEGEQVGDGRETVAAGVEPEEGRAHERTPTACPSPSVAEQEMNGQ